MPKFAVLENESVVNIIIADSKKIAEEITGSTCVEYTIEPAEPRGTFVGGKFIQAQPHPSWIREGDSGWKAPVDYPEIDENNPKFYAWDETAINWIEIQE